MWPFGKKTEKRSAGGYSDVITQAIEQAARVKVSDAGALAALEAASGFVGRAFMAAMVEPEMPGITPDWLALQGRQLVRAGESMSLVAMNGGMVELVPVAFWNFENFENDPDFEDRWEARITTYGPSTTRTRIVGRNRLVFVKWGTNPGTRYRGVSPSTWASLSSRLNAGLEKALADELGGPVAQILPIPHDPGNADAETDPLAGLKTAIGKAAGKAVLLESTAAGWDDGAAPRRDWMASRLGANPPQSLAMIQKHSFMSTLAACGLSIALFDDSDGTSKREALRQAHMGVVRPLARLLEHELTMRLDTPVRIRFDSYPLDMVSRAQVIEKLTGAGVAMNVAMEAVGL